MCLISHMIGKRIVFSDDIILMSMLQISELLLRKSTNLNPNQRTGVELSIVKIE